MSSVSPSLKKYLTHSALVSTVLGASFSACANERGKPAASVKTETSGPKTLILSFDAKGTAVGWDFGVAQAVQERLDSGKVSDVVFAGSSSGALLASYFGCHGLSEETTTGAVTQLTDWANKKLLNEHTKAKLIQLMLGEETDSPYENLQGIVDIVTDNGTCVPQYPTMITAANMDILDQRAGGPLGTKASKTVDLKNFDVIENGKRIGKACTYFVDDSLFRKLSAMKPEERLCDIRLMSKPEDLLLAIKGSVSEPTYYAPVEDTNPGAIQSIYGSVTKRVYNGGYVFMSPVQDIKRVLPDASVFGTGRGFFSRAQNRIVQSWFTFDMNRAQLDSRWFFDSQLQFTTQEWTKLSEITVVEQAKLGYQKTLGCLKDSKTCNSKIFTKPAFDKDVSGEPLEPKTRRGIDDLLKEQTMLSRFF